MGGTRGFVKTLLDRRFGRQLSIRAHVPKENKVQHDDFFWISTINKATVVCNRSEGLIDEATAKLAAGGIDKV